MAAHVVGGGWVVAERDGEGGERVFVFPGYGQDVEGDRRVGALACGEDLVRLTAGGVVAGYMGRYNVAAFEAV